MRNVSLRRTAALAVTVGLLIAALSGGAVTYASFTDSGSVDVTFTAANISDGSDEISETDSNTTDNETSTNDSDGDENETNVTDSNTTDNETSTNDSDGDENETNVTDSNNTDDETEVNSSDRLSGGSLATAIPAVDGRVDSPTGDLNPAAATAVDRRRLPVASPPRDEWRLS